MLSLLSYLLSQGLLPTAVPNDKVPYRSWLIKAQVDL